MNKKQQRNDDLDIRSSRLNRTWNAETAANVWKDWS